MLSKKNELTIIVKVFLSCIYRGLKIYNFVRTCFRKSVSTSDRAPSSALTACLSSSARCSRACSCCSSARAAAAAPAAASAARAPAPARSRSADSAPLWGQVKRQPISHLNEILLIHSCNFTCELVVLMMGE